MLLEKLDIHREKTENRPLSPCLSCFTKINSKYIKDLNIRPETTLKQLQEAVGNSLEQISIENDFLNRTLKVQDLRETMNKWGFIRLKIFLHSKRSSHQTQETAHSMRENLPATHPTRV
jgi:hypothetical protein